MSACSWMKATVERVTSTETVRALWAPCEESVTLRLAATLGMPSRLASSCSSTSSEATSLWAVTVRLGRLPTSSTPLRSRMRPRGATVVTVRVRLESACWEYSSPETSCIDHRRASRMPMIEPEKTPRPRRRPLNVFSALVSLPPAARGACPPMSRRKRAAPRLSTSTAATASAATSTTTPMSMSVEEPMG